MATEIQTELEANALAASFVPRRSVAYTVGLDLFLSSFETVWPGFIKKRGICSAILRLPSLSRASSLPCSEDSASTTPVESELIPNEVRDADDST